MTAEKGSGRVGDSRPAGVKPEADDVSGVNPFAERVKANVIQMATVVRQLWEGYLQSPHGC